MGEHVHVDAVHFLIIGAMILIWLFMFRLLAAKYADTTAGAALGAIVA